MSNEWNVCYGSLYEDLLQLWKSLETKFPLINDIFLPAVGDEYGIPGFPRIMFIGKGTAGWDGTPVTDHRDQARGSSEFFQSLNDGKSEFPFSRFVALSALEIMRACGIEAPNGVESAAREWARARIVWNNLMKIGANGSHPEGELAKRQRPLMIRLLKCELSALAPHAVVLVTSPPSGDYEAEVSWDVFDWKHQRDQELMLDDPKAKVWASKLDSPACRVYWTRHPQGWDGDAKSTAVQAIAQDFSKFWPNIKLANP
jgi:hypothetical protein